MPIHQVLSNDRLFAEYCRLRIALWPDCAEDCVAEAQTFLADPHNSAVFLALTEPRKPIGFIEISLRNYAESATISPVPFIEGWFVESAYRRQGVGRVLVNAAEQWASSRGFREIASDAQLHDTGSIAAHLRLGYQEVERNVCFLKQIRPR